MADSVINSCDTYFAKQLIFLCVIQAFLMSSYQKLGYVSIKIKRPKKQAFLSQSLGKPSKYSKLSLLQNHHCKTNIGTELRTLKHTQNSSILIKGSSFDEE